jgi:hypothetical protein
LKSGFSKIIGSSFSTITIAMDYAITAGTFDDAIPAPTLAISLLFAIL